MMLASWELLVTWLYCVMLLPKAFKMASATFWVRSWRTELGLFTCCADADWRENATAKIAPMHARMRGWHGFMAVIRKGLLYGSRQSFLWTKLRLSQSAGGGVLFFLLAGKRDWGFFNVLRALFF